MSRPYLLTIAVLLALSALSVTVGASSIDVLGAARDPAALQLLLISRVPRTLAALLSGAAMAVAGMVMQLMVRNRFVEPGTTGTTEGAMLGLLAVTLAAPGWSIMAKMGVSALTALASMAGFMMLVRRLPPAQPLLVPLVGLIYGGIIGAATTFVAYQADMLQYLGVWMSGEFSGILAGRYELLWLAGAMAAVVYIVADRFTILGLGRDASVGLGLNYRRVMALGLVSVSLVSALVVVTVGMLPFVGLVVPNIVSRIMGDNLRASLPVMAGMGAGLVLASDVLGRVLRHPYEIPAGTVFGCLGACVFLWLLLRRPAHAR